MKIPLSYTLTADSIDCLAALYQKHIVFYSFLRLRLGCCSLVQARWFGTFADILTFVARAVALVRSYIQLVFLPFQFDVEIIATRYRTSIVVTRKTETRYAPCVQSHRPGCIIFPVIQLQFIPRFHWYAKSLPFLKTRVHRTLVLCSGKIIVAVHQNAIRRCRHACTDK